VINRLLLTAALMLPIALYTAPAQAALPSGNVVANGDAEAGPGATNSTDHPTVPGWDTIPNFTAVVYGTPQFPATAVSAANGGGSNFFAGGPDNGFSDITAAQQQVDLSGAGPEIDQGNVQATLSADLGGFAGQGDSATVTGVFSDSAGQTFNGVLSLPAVTPEDRGGQTTLLHRTACTTVTPGARNLFVQVIMQRTDPSYNDGYADNVSVTLSTAPCPASPDAPLPPPEPPKPGVSANASVVSGRILVKRPGATGFQELTDSRSIPVGSEVDATKGVVSLQTAANTHGKTQKGKFYDGAFVMTQSRGKSPVTDLALSAPLDKCGGSKVTGAASRSRRLWGNGHGRFRTRGRYATATVRGTVWSMQDQCTSTKVTVARGTVLVRDLAKKRNVKVKAGHSYVARAKKPKNAKP
jgi:hypothetical protein